VKRSWTPPSDWNRISRTGPLPLMRPRLVRAATCAIGATLPFTCGLEAAMDPPLAGWPWHPAQLLRLKRGTSPVATVSASGNAALTVAENLASLAVRRAIGLPASPRVVVRREVRLRMKRESQDK
jgi:hypothetical protein